MTPIGHSLTGAAIGVACMPKRLPLVGKTVHLMAFMLLANIPDIPFNGWGHDRYYFSHSLFVNLLLIGLAVLILAPWKTVRQKIGSWTVMLGGALAWLSHLLLDSFYNQVRGVAIFWPYSNASLHLPIPWLAVMPASPPPLTPEMLHIFLMEFVTFSPLLILAILARKKGLAEHKK